MQALFRAPDNIWSRSHSLQTSQISTLALRAFSVDRDMSHLACKTGGARPKPAVDDDGAAYPFANCDVEKVSTAAACADLILAISSSIGIIFQFYSQAGLFHQLSMEGCLNCSRQVSGHYYP